MNKRNIIIISSVAGLLLLGLVGYFLFSKKTNPSNTDVSPSPNASDQPLLSDTNNNSNSLFNGTPDPNTNNNGSTLTTNSKGICPNQWIGQTDSDGDGLPDSVEAIYKTDPANPDSDSDGYKDGDEVKNGYDPMSPGSVRLDSDNDGLTDDQECIWKTDPFNPDTDGDTFKDGDEVKNDYDPLKPGNVKIVDTTTLVSTPAPSGSLILGNPTPTPTNTTTGTSLEMVKRSELKISSNTSTTVLKTYLAAIYKASPTDLISGSQIPDALTAAFKGDASKLLPVITRLKQHEQQIIAISTPEIAVTHQTLLVSLIRFVNQQLTIIATTAGKNTDQQYNAALELQKKLSANMGLLTTERQKLEELAK